MCVCECVCVKQGRSEEHTSELQSHLNLVCRLLLEKKKEIVRVSVCVCGVSCSVLYMCVFASEMSITRAARTVVTVSLCFTLVCVFVFFFFNVRAPPDFYSFPHPAALPT